MMSEERFWSKVNKTEGCWEWVGFINASGYGTFGFNGRMVLAHRHSFLIANGNLGKSVHHHCQNHKCVRPDHLCLEIPSNEERFWSKVNKTEGCWEWTGRLDKDGYGVFRLNSRNTRAHRYSFLFVFGSIGELSVLHKCDNPKCVNPEHLFLGTQANNVADALGKGRMVMGSRSIEAKLTEELVVLIRERYTKGGISQRGLGKEYGVSKMTIQRVLLRRTWKHV